MVGVVVVTHGDLGNALLRSADGFVGALPAMRVVEVRSGQGAAEVQRAICAAAEEVDSGSGVLFLVDLAGSTPSNACASECAHRRADLLCGVNLPMLLKLSSVDRNTDPSTLATELERTAQRSIRRRSELGKA